MVFEVEYVKSAAGWMMLGPKGVPKAPGVVILHGSDGRFSGWSYRDAHDLASSGFVAMPFGYSVGGSGWFAGDIVDVDLYESALAIRALRRHPAVQILEGAHVKAVSGGFNVEEIVVEQRGASAPQQKHLILPILKKQSMTSWKISRSISKLVFGYARDKRGQLSGGWSQPLTGGSLHTAKFEKQI